MGSDMFVGHILAGLLSHFGWVVELLEIVDKEIQHFVCQICWCMLPSLDLSRSKRVAYTSEQLCHVHGMHTENILQTGRMSTCLFGHYCEEKTVSLYNPWQLLLKIEVRINHKTVLEVHLEPHFLWSIKMQSFA